MEGYLGEFQVDLAKTEFAAFQQNDWVIYWIERYGQIDGDHHKAWALDQVARIVHGTPVVVREARWDNGHSEWRVTLGNPTENYAGWVASMLGDQDEFGEREYKYNAGVAP